MESTSETILIANKHIDTSSVLEKFLTKKNYKTARVSKGKDCLDWLKKNRAKLIISANELGDMKGLDLLEEVKNLYPDVQVIFTAENGNIREATKACRSGAYDYISTPFIPDEVLATIEQALHKNGFNGKHKNGYGYNHRAEKFVEGESFQFQTIKKNIDLVARTDISVIITGETGTGKEYVAREIHRLSHKNAGPFKAVDCGTLTNELAGSELFGHIKGAFTGAIEDKKGCFELANNGTLFLDEIGNLSSENQIKLLRVLQDREVTKLGASKGVTVNVRVLTASNEDLKEMVDKGTFRKDLYYRLNEFEIHVPPLRERPTDIRVFSGHFLNQANKQLNKKAEGFSSEAMDRFESYNWPGNLRELKNVIRRIVLCCDSFKIQVHDLPDHIKKESDSGFSSIVNVKFNNGMPDSLNALVEEVEQLTIIKILEKTGYNKAETSRILNIDRKTLYNKMKAYNISY